jgi:putative restriction endonuclease
VPADEVDGRVRLAAFAFLEEQTRAHGEVLPYSVLLAGFPFEGERVPLLGPQGIFKPKVLSMMPLSITTAPVVEGKDRPYADEIDIDGTLTYRYRGTDPAHRDNVGLRTAMQKHVPLIYLFGVAKGSYLPAWPVFIVGDDSAALAFKVEVDAAANSLRAVNSQIEDFGEGEARRRYITVQTQRRLHQVAFRERVLDAYRRACAICRLQHEELLDAAHILPDGHPKGEPVVRNGLALCKLHHAAFDQNILGIRPDLRVEIRLDILEERDGPMLQHGIQGFQGSQVRVPRSAHLRPESEFLAERYEMFRRAS